MGISGLSSKDAAFVERFMILPLFDSSTFEMNA
jgi:hypothetical protein